MLSRWFIVVGAFFIGTRATGNEIQQRVLKRSDVVFMYASTAEAYQAYGTTFVAWGGASNKHRVQSHRQQGIKCTGSVWCLTAGAKTLHANAVLREAVAIDIEGKPIAVPWQFDKVYEGQTTDFGNTNHPAFREHVIANVRRVMAGGADGLHVDDHLGVAHPAVRHGGGFDDYSIAEFRRYLKQHATPEQLEGAGVEDLTTFDYRNLVRRYVKTRDELRKRAAQIPLFELWKNYHLEAAADFVEHLRSVAEETAGHPVMLSANACLGSDIHHYVVPRLTHVVCEVWFNADKGTDSLGGAMKAYAAADRLQRPLACTASGHDWAHCSAHSAVGITRFWIALTYAHGHCFMVPHPQRQWCFNQEKGTHWYQAPVDEFAPLYRFIRTNATLFDGFETADDVTIEAPQDILVTARRHDKRFVLHVVNRDYDAEHDRIREARNVVVKFPAQLVERRRQAQLLSHDGPQQALPITVEGETASVTLPTQRLWTLIALE